jgi:hypothetical protein
MFHLPPHKLYIRYQQYLFLPLKLLYELHTNLRLRLELATGNNMRLRLLRLRPIIQMLRF